MMYTDVWYVAESSENVGNKPALVHMLGRDVVPTIRPARDAKSAVSGPSIKGVA